LIGDTKSGQQPAALFLSQPINQEITMITRSSRIAIVFAAFAAAAPLTAALADAPMTSAADVTNGSGDFAQPSMNGGAGNDTYHTVKRGPERPAENLDIDNASHNHGW
jgi:hypothetical protein